MHVGNSPNSPNPNTDLIPRFQYRTRGITGGLGGTATHKQGSKLRKKCFALLDTRCRDYLKASEFPGSLGIDTQQNVSIQAMYRFQKIDTKYRVSKIKVSIFQKIVSYRASLTSTLLFLIILSFIRQKYCTNDTLQLTQHI